MASTGTTNAGSAETLVASKAQTSMATKRRALDLMHILKHREFRCFESICNSLEQYPQPLIDSFISTNYLESDTLQNGICSVLLLSLHHSRTKGRNAVNERDAVDVLTSSLLLTLPFVNCSQSVGSAICQKYVMQWDKHCGSTLCRGLVFALNQRVSVVPLTVKTHIVCTLCSIIEYQQRFKLSAKIKDAFGGLVAQSLQILQCEASWSHSKVFLIKQYAARVLLCELNEGVMARQGLKDHFTALIVLKTVIGLHEKCEVDAAVNFEGIGVLTPTMLNRVEC